MEVVQRPAVHTPTFVLCVFVCVCVVRVFVCVYVCVRVRVCVRGCALVYMRDTALLQTWPELMQHCGCLRTVQALPGRGRSARTRA